LLDIRPPDELLHATLDFREVRHLNFEYHSLRRSHPAHKAMAYQPNWETRYPCEIGGCDYDFLRLADMQRHVKEYHGGPIYCPEPDCNWRGAKRGAKREARLERHLSEVHRDIRKGEPLEHCRLFVDVSPIVILNVPGDFGATPEASLNVLAQVAQPQSSVPG
jgi:hypothetical protein